jgi:hypothetical protein
LFILAKATIVPFCMALKLLGFVRAGFVGKLTKRMDGYNKQAHWSNIDGA